MLRLSREGVTRLMRGKFIYDLSLLLNTIQDNVTPTESSSRSCQLNRAGTQLLAKICMFADAVN